MLLQTLGWANTEAIQQKRDFNTMTAIDFRWAVPADYDALGTVMFDAVHSGGSPYSHDQKQAWIAAPRSGEKWHDRLSKQDIIIAQFEQRIIAFMSLAENEYLDFAYIVSDYRGHGLFRKLYEHIEKRAVELRCRRIWVHASLMAAPAFRAMGFETLKREQVSIGNQHLERFVMEKMPLTVFNAV